MLHKNRIIWIALFAMALLLAACSPSAEKLNGAGNQAFLEQAYQDALVAYQSAQIENPELAEPYYNAANAFYREGNYEAALEQLQHALSFAGDDQLVENSLYNIGNNFFNAQDLGSAIEAYKQALLIDPKDQEAKYNLELALQQQEQQEQQQQEQEQNQEEQQNQDGSEGDDISDEQSEDSQNSGDPAEEEDGEQEQSNDQTGEAEEQDEKQDGEPQPGEDNQNQDENSSGQGDQPIQPVERMTEEQAKQMLAAIANDMETLQEKLGKILFVRGLPPLQDW